MNFLKKAKALSKELESDLNKATKALGLDDKEDKSSAPPHASSSTAPTVYTPTSSAPPPSNGSYGPQSDAGSYAPARSAGGAPVPQFVGAGQVNTSVPPADGAQAKLSMIIKKNIRDEWEIKIEGLNQQLSAIMQTQWTCFVDCVPVYTYANETFAKERPGVMFRDYFTRAVEEIGRYIDRQGPAARNELNRLAWGHIMTLEPSNTIAHSGCDIDNGKLRLLFNGKYLSYNIQDCCKELGDVVNKTGRENQSSSELDFNAKQNIKQEYEPNIGQILAKAQHELHSPSLQFTPNFEANYAKLAHYAAADPDSSRNLPREWERRFGKDTLQYFAAFADHVQSAGYAKDDMMLEAFGEAVPKSEVSFRVVDELQKKTYNEIIVENGVLVMQCVPQYWITNIKDLPMDLEDLL